MRVADIPKGAILFMVASTWHVEVDHDPKYSVECGQPVARDHPDYEDEMEEVAEAEAAEERYLQGPASGVLEVDSGAYEVYDGSGHLWHENDTSTEQMEWREEAMGRYAVCDLEDEFEFEDGAIAVIHNFATDTAAGLQWAKRCRAAVQQLTQAGAGVAGDANELHFGCGAFSRVTREVAQDFKTDLKWGPYAIECIQMATEAHLRETLSAANSAAIWADRKLETDDSGEVSEGGVQVEPRDIQLMRRLRGERS
jgi:histone H3/H4